jgi:hypothetical protein
MESTVTETPGGRRARDATQCGIHNVHKQGELCAWEGWEVR